MNKKCRRCLTEKRLDDFYGWKPSVCKDCHRKNDKERYEKRKKYFSKYKAKWYSIPKNQKRHSLISRKYAITWLKKHPKERKAYSQFHYALYSGKLYKPKQCSQCGERKKIEAHHPDYTKPLEVIWLCRSCHKILHQDFP